MLAFVPKTMMGKLLTEPQWRSIGIQQSEGWYTLCFNSQLPSGERQLAA
jgi:hypothetical protein